MNKMFRLVLAAAGSGALLVGCSSVGETDLTSPDSSTNSAAAGELVDLTVGVIPASDSVPVYLGVEEGIFEKHGLNVTVETAGGGAAITSSVLSGAIDIGLSNVVSSFIARSEDFPITIIAPTSASTGGMGDGEDYGALLAAPEANDIQGPKDLEGKTVAINALNNANDVLVREAITQAGGDPSKVSFVEIGFQDLPGALGSGRVDAAVLPEPFITMAKDAGARWVFPMFAGVVDNYPSAIFVTTDQYIAENEDTVNKFRDALAEAAEMASGDEALARETLASYTEMDPDLLARVALPAWPSELNVDAVNEFYDLTAKYGIIEASDEDKAAVVNVP